MLWMDVRTDGLMDNKVSCEDTYVVKAETEINLVDIITLCNSLCLDCSGLGYSLRK